MTTTMTTNLKAETLMNLPVLAALGDAEPAVKVATIHQARQPHISWLVPCVALLAGVLAYQALGNLAEINAYLTGVEQAMQSPQF